MVGPQGYNSVKTGVRCRQAWKTSSKLSLYGQFKELEMNAAKFAVKTE